MKTIKKTIKKKKSISIYNIKPTRKTTRKATPIYIPSKNVNTQNTEKLLISIINKVEFTILITTLINQILYLIKIKTPKANIKKTMIISLKAIRKNNRLIKKNITDIELNIIFNNLYKNTILLKKNMDNNKSNHKSNNIHSKHNKYTGGYYFKSLEDKEDQPLTGADMTALLDELQAFFSNIQYLEEGAFVKDSNTLLSLLRGDTDSFKSYVMNTILPKYYTTFPPFIKWDNVKEALNANKLQDVPDYMAAYQTFMRSRDEYLISKGLKSPDVLNGELYTGFFNKLQNSLNDNISKYNAAKSKLTGTAPLSFPL
jgi:hypothetical protein